MLPKKNGKQVQARISKSFDRASQLGAPLVRVFLKAPGTDPKIGLDRKRGGPEAIGR